MVVVLLMNNGFIPTSGWLFLIGVVEELRTVEVLLLGTEEVFKVRFIPSRKIDLNQLILQ